MRVTPFLLTAALLAPAGVLAHPSTAARGALSEVEGQNRVPPKGETVNDSPREDRTPPQAVPRETPPPQQSAPPPPPPQRSAPPPTSTPQSAPPRTTAPTAAAPESGGQAQERQRVPPEARRDGSGSPRTGNAVPRPPYQPPRTRDDREDRRDNGGYYYPSYGRPVYNSYYYYPRAYYPYGYGAYGLGYFYYDPYVWDPYYSAGYYGGPYAGYGAGYPTGEVRLQVRPRDADVFVDGYYAGRVDDFDGAFQSLTVEEGGHRIEIRAPGYEPLFFDVRVLPGRKTTYRGDLLRRRP